MKKLIIAAIVWLGITAQAQTTNLNPGAVWAQNVCTNLQIGPILFPFSTNGWGALNWCVDRYNKAYNLTGTNRYSVKDIAANLAYNEAERLVPDYLADLDAKESRVAIRVKLSFASDDQLAQIKAILGIP